MRRDCTAQNAPLDATPGDQPRSLDGRAAIRSPLSGGQHLVTESRRPGALTSWQEHIGPPRLTRADSPDGLAILDLFRGDNPLSLVTQLRTTRR
nr:MULTISPECIES: hypothetical protein [unclassified Mycobacterium]